MNDKLRVEMMRYIREDVIGHLIAESEKVESSIRNLRLQIIKVDKKILDFMHNLKK